jgi:hypothetical protein
MEFTFPAAITASTRARVKLPAEPLALLRIRAAGRTCRSGRRISSFADWKTEMVRQADKACRRALGERDILLPGRRVLHFEEDPDKVQLYDRFAGCSTGSSG